MSNLLQELFYLAMDELPYLPDPAMDRAENALEKQLGPEGIPLLRAYEDAWYANSWEDAKRAFFLGLSLGIELGTFTPTAGVCRRR